MSINELSLSLRKELGDIAYNFKLNDRIYTFYHDGNGLRVSRNER